MPYDHVPCQLLCSQVHHNQRSRGLTPNRPEPRLRSDPDAHGRPALTPFFRAGLPMAWGSPCSPGASQRPRALLSADGGLSETSEEPPGSHLSQSTAALKRQDAGRGRTTGFRASGRFQGSSWTLKYSSNHKGASGPGRGVRERPGGLVSSCCEATPPARGGSDPAGRLSSCPSCAALGPFPSEPLGRASAEKAQRAGPGQGGLTGSGTRFWDAFLHPVHRTASRRTSSSKIHWQLRFGAQL